MDWVLLTTTYIINRTPSHILEYKSPYEMLFHRIPDYSFFKTFGCAYYPNLSATRQDKLSPKFTLCTFLGYSYSHKGYRCFDNKLKKVYNSRNVTFEESVFPFGSCEISSEPASTSVATVAPDYMMTAVSDIISVTARSRLCNSSTSTS